MHRTESDYSFSASLRIYTRIDSILMDKRKLGGDQRVERGISLFQITHLLVDGVGGGCP